MARLIFRQGLVRYQTDMSDNPTFLQKSGQYIQLVVSPDPTIFTIAHFDQDYLFTENASVPQAWGPFTGTQDYYLFWDINLITGVLTRGYTTLAPIFAATAPSAPNPVNNQPWTQQHWFDTTNMVWKVKTSNNVWTEVLRCFAAKYQGGSTLIPYQLGTQYALSGKTVNVVVYAGYPLFDDANLPIQRFRKDRRGVFIHTEMPLASQWSRLANFKIETAMLQGEATENIPMFYAVAYDGPNKLALARNTQPSKPAIGVAVEDMFVSEVRMFIAEGFLQNDLWNWDTSPSGTQPAGTPLFVGSTGQLTSTPPQTFSIQQIAIVVDPQTIYVCPKQVIQYGPDALSNLVNIALDKTTGRYIAKEGAGGGTFGTSGFVHEQAIATTSWNINHNGTTEFVVVQLYDETNSVILPDSINVIDANNVTVTWAAPQAGRAHVVLLQVT